MLSLSAVACLNDTPVAPNSAPLRLALRAQITDAGQTAQHRVQIRVYYLRQNQQAVDLPSAPGELLLAPGTTTTHDISVQIGPCLDDEFRISEDREGCTVFIELNLLAENGDVLASDTHGVHATGDETSIDAPPFVLAGSRQIVVIDDSNLFDARAMSNGGNALLVQNLVNFSTTLARGTATVVQLDCGRPGQGVGDNSDFCTFDLSQFKLTVQASGYTVRQTASAAGNLTTILPDVKVLLLITPCQNFTTAEVNALKLFASEGGRVVLVGEWTDYFGSCRNTENQLLAGLGATLQSVNGALECDDQQGSITAASIRAHQITAGVSSLTAFCASELLLGAGDEALFLDRTNTRVIAALATISTAPGGAGPLQSHSPASSTASHVRGATRDGRTGGGQ